MKKLEEIKKVREIVAETDYSTVTEILDSFCPEIKLSVRDFTNKDFELRQNYTGGSNLLFRARILDKKTNTPYKLLQDLSYIPEEFKHKIDKYGRVNKPGESMFYASTQMPIACIETFSKGESMKRFIEKGSLMLAVSVWKIERPMKFVQMISPEKYFQSFIEEYMSLDLSKVKIETVRKQNQILREQIGDEYDFRLLEFFSEEFAKTNTIDHNEYKISNYFADRVFNRNPKFRCHEDFDGIWYPSVPSGYQETNIVLPPSKVDEKLKFLWADIVWAIYSPKTGKIEFHTIQPRAKVNASGEMEWRLGN